MKKVTLNLKIFCWILILVGLIMVLISSVEITNAYWIWDNYLKELTSAIGTTLVSAGLVSIVLEIGDIKDIVSNSINKLLQGDFSFKGYSEEKLILANEKIALNRISLDENSDSLKDSAYQYYEPKLLNLIKGCYYNYHKATFRITPSNDSKLFKYDVKIDYEIINNHDGPYTTTFKIISLTPENDNSNISLKEFKINNVAIDYNLDSANDVIIEPSDFLEGYVNKIFCFKYDLKNAKSAKVTLHYDYYASIDDRLQTFKISLPCKQLEHKIYISEDKSDPDSSWALEAKAFSSFFISNIDVDDTVRVEQSIPTAIKINGDEWLLPGSGYANVFKKNINK